MAGLLDIFDSPDGRFSLGLLAAAGPRVQRGGLGERLQDAVGIADQFKQQQQANAAAKTAQEMQMLQMDAMKRQAEQQRAMEALAARYRIPGSPEIGANEMDSMPVPAKPAGFDFQGYAHGLAGVNPMAGLDLIQKLQKDTSPLSVKQGETLLDRGTLKPIFSNAAPKDQPTAVQEYQFAVGQGYPGTFEQWDTARKKAGATNVTTKVETKMGDSVAGQIGPMAKDSRIQAQGAVQMFDAADRIGKALDSNKVTSGPLASQIQTVKQLVQTVGGGNDESIRQTRQVIKSLAQMSVEARKQLQGQGQVTESEAAAVAKADSGDINDLTTGELRDLVTLTKRAAHLRAKEHSNVLKSMESNDATRPTVPFYQVQGLEPLLNHNPQLPKIGGSAIDSLVDKYRSK